MGESQDTVQLVREIERLKRRLHQAETREGQDPDRLRGTLDSMFEGLQVIGFDWRYLYLNEAAARHARRSRSELLGRTMMECYPGIEESEMFATLRRCMEERQFFSLENEFAYDDGTTAWFELHFEPAPEGVAVLSLDVTERKQLEEQLRHSQKLEAVGRLAGAVAHDFNNVLMAILSFASFAESEVEEGSQAQEDMGQVIRAANRAAELSKQLLAFSRREVMHSATISLSALLRDLEPMLRRLLRPAVELRIEPPPESWRVKIDPGLMEQVLVNLAINARDAMPEGGALTIDVTRSALESSARGHLAGLESGEYLVLAVSDTGCGMPVDVQARIFEPFFTTKGEARGTGLGLSTSLGIIKQAGGVISVESEPRQGTTFKIYLPRYAEADLEVFAPGPEEEAADEEVFGGSGTILVVDDDEAVRGAVRRTLSRAGYRVLVATGTEEAAAAAASDHAIDLLITDVVLAGSDGMTVAEGIRGEHPRLAVLYMSGYTDASGHTGLGGPGIHFIEKPFSPDLLARRVRDILKRPRD